MFLNILTLVFIQKLIKRSELNAPSFKPLWLCKCRHHKFRTSFLISLTFATLHLMCGLKRAISH